MCKAFMNSKSFWATTLRWKPHAKYFILLDIILNHDPEVKRIVQIKTNDPKVWCKKMYQSKQSQERNLLEISAFQAPLPTINS